jgi:hypothetical protein
MKSSIITVASLLAVAVTAQPHGHQHRHVKKDAPMVIVTEMVSTTTTIGVTETIWVTEGQEPSSKAPVTSATKPNVVSSASSSVAVPSPSSTKQEAAQFFETPKVSSAEKPATTAVAPTTSTYVAPAPVPTSSQVQVQEAVAPSSSVAPVVVPSSSAAPVVVQQPTTAAAATAPVATSSSSSGSSSSGSGGAQYFGGKCTQGSSCKGSTSYYDITGTTACGNMPDGTTLPIVAMSSDLMGPLSNSNPLCGKTITVTYKGASVVATIVDKCPGCTVLDLDLSHAAFKALTPEYETIGRTDTTWYFN